MSNGWTPERRQRQSKMIKQWKPWEKSTGPRTEAGKQSTAQNAQNRSRMLLDYKEIGVLLNKQSSFLMKLINST
jgi:hypothetical protein